MEYESPSGLDLASYVDPDPATGTDGSLVRAPAIENVMRELHYLIEQASLVPDRGDLTQVYQAIAALIGAASRPKLLANIDYYVSAAGSDSSNGLTVGTPFLTLQKAIDVIYKLDLNRFTATVNVANGTYTAPVVASAPFVGEGTVRILGNVGAPQNVLLNVTGANAITVSHGARLHVEGMEVRSSGAGGIGLLCSHGEASFASVRWGACTNYQIQSEDHGLVWTAANYTISGGASSHWRVINHGEFRFEGAVTVTLSGTPNFSGSFATAFGLGLIHIPAGTYSGSATGIRFGLATNAVVETNTGNLTLLPGNQNGVALTGAQYQ